MIRYAGIFSNRWRHRYLPHARASPAQEESQAPTQNGWAERQQQFTGVNPLICLTCNKPMIFIGTLFGNWFRTAEYFAAGGKDATIPKALINQDKVHDVCHVVTTSLT